MANVKATKSGSGIFTNARAHKPHLLTHGISGEVMDLRGDVAKALAPLAAITVDEFQKPAAGATLVLSYRPQPRAGGTPVLYEVVDGALVAPPTGTISAAGTYTPQTAPNGAHSYAVFYEASVS